MSTKEQLREDISQARWREQLWTARRDEAIGHLEAATAERERAEAALKEMEA